MVRTGNAEKGKILGRRPCLLFCSLRSRRWIMEWRRARMRGKRMCHAIKRTNSLCDKFCECWLTILATLAHHPDEIFDWELAFFFLLDLKCTHRGAGFESDHDDQNQQRACGERINLLNHRRECYVVECGDCIIKIASSKLEINATRERLSVRNSSN